jgi:tRNA1(Val) A37 N6-methylase TrmN6
VTHPFTPALSRFEQIEDLQCDGLKIIVQRDGFRYGTDSILLANYVKAGCGDKIVELCSGLGAVSVLLSAKTRAARITGLEIQAPLVALSNRTAILNGIADKVRFIEGDVREIRKIMGAGAADVVVANPPYLRRGSGNGGLDAGAAIAKHEICCELADVVSAAGWLLGQGGSLYIVYRPERLVDLLCAMRASGIEPKELQPAGANAEKPPSIVLVRGVKGAAAGLRYLRQIML